MRWKPAVLGVCASVLGGCSLTQRAAHNLANETVEHWDERKLSRRLRAEARDVWAKCCAQVGGHSLTSDFGDGFQDGYVDYLESGGNTSPPAVPPLKYRRSQYLNPEGHALIREYFSGFKAGADTAAASGRRQFLTIPVVLPDALPDSPPPGRRIPDAAPSMPPPPLKAGDTLPMPRKMDTATGLPVPDRPTVPTTAPPPLLAPPVEARSLAGADPMLPKPPVPRTVAGAPNERASMPADEPVFPRRTSSDEPPPRRPIPPDDDAPRRIRPVPD